MGISILSGTITTLGSGVFLFGGKMVTFNKFAVIITSTISFSFLTAMLLFGSLCHIVGPQDNIGDIYCCFKQEHLENSGDGHNREISLNQGTERKPDDINVLSPDKNIDV